MNSEILLKEIIDKYDYKKINQFFDIISKQWLYFFFNEINGKVKYQDEEDIVQLFKIDKNNPIVVPMIIDEKGRNGVLYLNRDLAIKSVEYECKIGKMRGKDAFDLFFEIEDMDSFYIQGDYGSILPSEKDVEKFVEIYA